MITLTPEIKAQLAEQKKQCVFCKIISKEVQSNIIFEDSTGIAVLDIFPVSKGHITYLPKEHYPLMMYLQPNEFRHFFSLLPPLAKAVQLSMVATAINIFIAGGGAAGVDVAGVHAAAIRHRVRHGDHARQLRARGGRRIVVREPVYLADGGRRRNRPVGGRPAVSEGIRAGDLVSHRRPVVRCGHLSPALACRHGY